MRLRSILLASFGNVNAKNTDLVVNCPAKTASSGWITVGPIAIPRNGTVALTATPRAGWQFMQWTGCNAVNGATCTSTVSVVDADYSTTPRAIFREIVPVSIDAKPAALTSATTPTFGFSSPVAGTTFSCQIDASAVACSGSSITPATYTFTVDTAAPQTTLDPASGPGEGALQTASSETFKLVSSEPTGATFECSLDGAAFTPCDATVPLTGLAPGPHTFEARTIDRAGNVDATAVRRSWTIAIPDADGDGFNARTDCNDANPAVFPGGNDLAGNGSDENCDDAEAVTAAPVAVPSAAPARPSRSSSLSPTSPRPPRSPPSSRPSRSRTSRSARPSPSPARARAAPRA